MSGFVSADAPLPPLSSTLKLPKPDLSFPLEVRYEWPEDDPTTQATLVVRWGSVYRLVPQRRKRLERWRDRDGQWWGRCTWQYVAPRRELLPDPYESGGVLS